MADQRGDEFVVEEGKLFGYGGMAFFRTGDTAALAALAAKAAPENWDDASREVGQLPVLHNYIRYTFRRIHEEGKLVESDDGGTPTMSFNTGLYTPTWQAIYGCFQKNFIPGKQPWFFNGWFTESEGPMKPFVGREPRRAEYFTDPRALLFDPSLKFVENVDHMLDHHVERYPEQLQADAFRRHQAVNYGLGVAKKMVEQNWQIAVPMYYFEHAPNQEPISLLLPLCLLEPGKADIAIVVGPYGPQYKAYTVLTLEDAYRSARLIAKPAAAWLGHGGVIEPDQPVVTSPGWRKVSEVDRCPVCGQTQRCVMAADNRRAICVRIAEGGQPVTGRADAWTHELSRVQAPNEEMQ